MSRRLSFGVAAVGVVLLLVSSGACSSRSETAELPHDVADDTVPGNLPTAPPRQADDDAAFGADANRLLDELDGIREESDLCAILSGEAFEGLIGQEVDAAALVTNPAGITRLIAAIDGTFAHMVVISPPELVPAMETFRGVWTRIATLGPTADAEARANEIFAEPQVVAAAQAVLAWAPANCADPAGT